MCLSILYVTGIFLIMIPVKETKAQQHTPGTQKISVYNSKQEINKDKLKIIYPGNWQNASKYVLHTLDNNDGYLIGTNLFEDLAKGQHFRVEEPYYIHGIFFWVGVIKGTSGHVDFCIWSFNEKPGEKIASVRVPANQVAASDDISNSFYVSFNPPVKVESDYLAGIDLSDMGWSEIALYSSSNGDGGKLDMAWEQWDTRSWITIMESWLLDIDIGIFPYVSSSGEVSPPDPYADIDYDALIIKFLNGEKEIIPLNNIKAIHFDYFTFAADYTNAYGSSIPVKNFPNPFSETTTLEFELENHGDVGVAIYDITGRLMRNFHSQDGKPGKNRLIWDGNDMFGRPVNSGVYICKLLFEGRYTAHKLIVLK